MGASRVLHIIGGMNRGGVETWLMHVLRSIDRNRCQMDFLSHTPAECEFDSEIRSIGSNVIFGGNPYNPLRYAKAFRNILKEYGPYDVIHSHVHYFTGFVLRLAHSAGIAKRVAHSHTDTSIIDGASGWFRSIYMHRMRTWISKYATTCLAASEPAASSLYGRDWKENTRIKVLHYGIDLTRFSRDGGCRTLRKEIGILDNCPIIGHVGRFTSEKNHTFLLRIAGELWKRNPGVHMVLVGDGPLRSQIEREANASPYGRNIHFLGIRQDVPEIMSEMNVLLLPSLWEGLGLVLVEAQAAGLPFVMSDRVPKEVIVLPELGQIVSLEDSPSVWGEVALGLATRQRISNAERLTIIEKSTFSIRASTEALLREYQN